MPVTIDGPLMTISVKNTRPAETKIDVKPALVPDLPALDPDLVASKMPSFSRAAVLTNYSEFTNGTIHTNSRPTPVTGKSG